MGWLRKHRRPVIGFSRPRPLLGFMRDFGVLWFLFWSVQQADSRWLWVGIACTVGCFAYDIRLMWIDAGKRLGL